MRVRACVRACACACVRACVRVCVCVFAYLGGCVHLCSFVYIAEHCLHCENY